MTIARDKDLNATTIRTMRGTFDFANPKAADVNMIDILDAISRENRYANHVPRGYTVAEHSLLTLQVARVLRPCLSFDEARAVLVHDFAEGYTGDVSSPLKHAIGPVWTALETRIEDAVFEAIGVDVRSHTTIVKAADNAAYLLERHFLYGWEDVTLPPQILGHLADHGPRFAFGGRIPFAGVGYTASQLRYTLERELADLGIRAS